MLLHSLYSDVNGLCHTTRRHRASVQCSTGRTHRPRTNPGRVTRLLMKASLQQKQQVAAVTSDPSEDASAALPTPPQGNFEVTLRGMEVLQTVRLGLVPQGRGQAVVVTQVAEGSRAEQLGVRRGQKLVALSDPMRYGTMWGLEDRPSLRFVVDTFKMRRGAPVDLQLEPLMGPEDLDAFFGSPSEAIPPSASGSSSSEPDVVVEGVETRTFAADSGSGSDGGTSTSGSSNLPPLDMSPDSALASLNSIDQMMGSGSDSEGSGQTIGERLAARHAAQQRAQAAVNQVQRRIDRRKAYMEIDDQRDDTGLLLGLAAAFLLPALVILAVAYCTGYLDRLYFTALTLR